MRKSQFVCVALILPALTGCGTIRNLQTAPDGQSLLPCDGSCYPFGGVARSGLLAAMGPPMGVSVAVGGNVALARGEFDQGRKEIGSGLILASAGVVAIADCPLSLAGDILTLPVA